MILSSLPKEFLELSKPVKKLFYKGNLSLLEQPKVAIIGSRKMSVYTKNLVLELSFLLKEIGVCVVSGGAIGVDICAAKGAFPSTIAIFANGLDQIYPKSNEHLIKQIYEHALALSENEPKYLPQRYDFLLRNRLIIALSKAVVVAQADLQSGSLQSANLALKLNKPLFVLPQRLDESKGTNLLLAQNKARLIHDLKDFALCFGELKKREEDDEVLEFCKKGVSLDEALDKFGERVYEYELLGKIEINGVFIRVLV
ncbi:DNA processing protein DprA [Campylobacter sp. MIT 99-7217]|uniref:DNA-processing protein DprA n=1 Tax=Campylobacter sp. MIT 99-7217 TaxID=535091 RepID=UPI001158F47A|nr:DNA-processing protein DprA [Campylobacter sp. MIT 99-7217]TQR34622.1 DNA processing protein DprA [Campylobacter sp. MIT 99-7217]